jgi:hypothetical protein
MTGHHPNVLETNGSLRASDFGSLLHSEPELLVKLKRCSSKFRLTGPPIELTESIVRFGHAGIAVKGGTVFIDRKCQFSTGCVEAGEGSGLRYQVLAGTELMVCVNVRR